MSDFPKIAGIGIDACQIARMEAQLNKEHFLNRLFAFEELAYVQAQPIPAQSLAAIYAAKEAALKAFGVGLGAVPLKDIAVLHHPSGQPYYRMTGAALERLGSGAMHLSLTHEGDLAIAMAVFEKSEDSL
jgi:holo-[acyl-carrier-protein] synthase